ncbi:Uncharacterised protein [Mycolicibacterium vanbaalenii]|uniref:Uncharacterized protein n=1 Tax=Mycolicibacterium vanbaalenii TaxID=110539 RepID=A0A5S9PZY9_MYCVN|nr:hypothetical protein [Mycolicibacterium vanbaalenii]CAA0110102.1 Uncharacterised protein [Mycolicibacterium vanbaalenii]
MTDLIAPVITQADPGGVAGVGAGFGGVTAWIIAAAVLVVLAAVAWWIGGGNA